jgi:hypothetical protein
VNSWQTLLMIDMARGKYLSLSRRPPTQYDWLTLWGLVQEEQVRIEA